MTALEYEERFRKFDPETLFEQTDELTLEFLNDISEEIKNLLNNKLSTLTMAPVIFSLENTLAIVRAEAKNNPMCEAALPYLRQRFRETHTTVTVDSTALRKAKEQMDERL